MFNREKLEAALSMTLTSLLFLSTHHCEAPVGITGFVGQPYSFKLQKMRQNHQITQLDCSHLCPPDPNITPSSMPQASAP